MTVTQQRRYQALQDVSKEKGLEDLRDYYTHFVHPEDIVDIMNALPGLLGASEYLSSDETLAFIEFLDTEVKPYLEAKNQSLTKPNVSSPSHPRPKKVRNRSTPKRTPVNRKEESSSRFSELALGSSSSCSSSSSSSSSDSQASTSSTKGRHSDKELDRVKKTLELSFAQNGEQAAATKGEADATTRNIGLQRPGKSQESTIAELEAALLPLQAQREKLIADYAPIKKEARAEHVRRKTQDDSIDFGIALVALRDCLAVEMESLYPQEIASVPDWSKKSVTARLVIVRDYESFDDSKLFVNVHFLVKVAHTAIDLIKNRNHYAHYVGPDKIDFALDRIFSMYGYDRSQLLPQNAKSVTKGMQQTENKTLNLTNAKAKWSSKRRKRIAYAGEARSAATPTQRDGLNLANQNTPSGAHEMIWSSVEKDK